MCMDRKIRYHWFTLIEVTLTLIIIWLIIPSIFAIYTFLIRANREIWARERVVQQWYEFYERLNILMQDYTVDYEEYFNRQMVWCVWNSKVWANFKWNIEVPGYCTEFTAYGNQNNNNGDKNMHDVYYCTSFSDRQVHWSNKVTRVVAWNICGNVEGKQSYGQYAALFKDVKGWTWIIVWTEDDEELWTIFNSSVDAIGDWSHIQELYLISHDWKKRLYFRRKNVASVGEEPHYKIQILRLRWFDAWRKHNFDDGSQDNAWRYDGVIDTWVCDTSMWFIGQWASVWWAYSDYKLPKDVDDCWVDLTYGVANIISWNISISPLWDPDLYWANPDRQINTYLKILTVNGIYVPALLHQSRLSSSLKNYSVPLETTINMKDFYRWYSE